MGSKDPGASVGLIVGKRFGRLVVDAVEKSGPRWRALCTCDCGGKSSPIVTRLVCGHTKSCGGCPVRNDLVGQRFGKLTVLSLCAGKPTAWVCQCDCGSPPKPVLATGLTRRNKSTKSCGCDQYGPTKQSSQIAVGSVFGDLEVIRLGEKNKQGVYRWDCRCKCGRVISERGWTLLRGKRDSCGKCRFDDVVGRKFGMLTVRELLGIGTDGKRWCLCDCDCGTISKRVRLHLVMRESTKSCGCKSAAKRDIVFGVEMTAQDLAEILGVSIDTARARFQMFRRDGREDRLLAKRMKRL